MTGATREGMERLFFWLYFGRHDQFVLIGFQDSLDDFITGRLRERQSSLTSRFQPFLRVTLGQFQQSHTGAITLLLDFEMIQNRGNDRACARSDLCRPFQEPFVIPLQIFLMIGGMCSMTVLYWPRRPYSLRCVQIRVWLEKMDMEF